MHVSLFSAVAALSVSAVSASPFSFANNPINNGFPAFSAGSAALTGIEVQAQGTLSNAPPPTNAPGPNSLTSLQLIAFNEVFEVAFFTELIANITNNVQGYQINHQGARNFILRALTAVQGQEELHALNANKALQHFTGSSIQPCEYNFPVADFESAINLATTFTDVVLGVLPAIQEIFGQEGVIGLIGGVGSVIGQEGEQNGFYRQMLDKTPSALPFLTAATREFAFSALQGFVADPSNCAAISQINITSFLPLVVDTTPLFPTPYSVNLSYSFSFDYAQPSSWNSDFSGLSLVYINQQNLPVVEPLTNAAATSSNGVTTVTFQGLFPFDLATNGSVFGNGLTIAAVTAGAGPFASAQDVANNAIFGPGLIELY